MRSRPWWIGARNDAELGDRLRDMRDRVRDMRDAYFAAEVSDDERRELEAFGAQIGANWIARDRER